MASRHSRQTPKFAVCLRTILCVDQVAGTAQLRAGDRRLVAAQRTGSIGARRIPIARRPPRGGSTRSRRPGRLRVQRHRALERLYSLLDGLAQDAPPVPDAPAIGGVTWVRPLYVGEVAFREYNTLGGLRHSSWKGLRESRIADVGMPDQLQ